MPTYTFACTCGWRGDVRTTFDKNNVSCPSCASTAHKESVYRLNFGGFAKTPSEERDWSTPYKHFNEASAEMDYKISRLEEATQATVKPPPLYQMAKARADQLMSQGATVDDLS